MADALNVPFTIFCRIGEFERLLRAENMPDLPLPMKEYMVKKGGKND